MATAPIEPLAGTEARERTPLPAAGTPAADLRREMEEAASGDLDWLTRMATGTNYPAGDDVLEVAKEAYLRFFSTNGLLPHTFPSLARFERDVVDYAAGLFHGPDAVGSITSGGSESILMGVKSARDRARRRPPGDHPAAHGRARIGPPGLHQGRRLLRPRGDPGPARSRTTRSTSTRTAPR